MDWAIDVTGWVGLFVYMLRVATNLQNLDRSAEFERAWGDVSKNVFLRVVCRHV